MMNGVAEASHDGVSTYLSNDDLTRRLAKLTDDNWAKDLEIQNLRRLHASEESVSMRLKAEMSLHLAKLDDSYYRQNELEEMVAAKEAELQSFKEESKRLFREASNAHRSEMDALQRTNAALRQRLDEVQGVLGEKQAEVEHSSRAYQEALHKTTLQADAFRLREAQLTGEIAKLRADQTRAETGLAGVRDELSQARSAIEELKGRHALEVAEVQNQATQALSDVQSRLEAEFQKRFEAVLSENGKLRQMLEMRDDQMEIDRNNLKKWQEQLNFFDQHLRQTKTNLKRDKTEILKLAKQFTVELQELRTTRDQIFTEYARLTESEIAKTRDQISNTSSLSPQKAKLEERLEYLDKHRGSLLAGLDRTQALIGERLDTLNAIVRNATVL
jgi:chromosome segregation ATPase